MSPASSNLLGRSVAALARLPAIVRWCGPIVVMLVLWWSSSRQPAPSAPNVLRALLHNGMHVVAYACLAASFWLALCRVPAAARVAFRSRGAWLLALLYGIVDEVHQAFVPGRSSSVADVVSDALGAACAVMLLRWAVGLAPGGMRAALLLCLGGCGSAALATFVDF